jgi:putative transposase
LHLGTWDRLPLITLENKKQVYEAVLEKCKNLGISVIALGGTPDHIHILVCFPPTSTVADFIKGVKGSSSHLMSHQINIEEFFKWQGSYATFYFCEREVPRIKAYIQHQKEHHGYHQEDALLEMQ